MPILTLTLMGAKTLSLGDGGIEIRVPPLAIGYGTLSEGHLRTWLTFMILMAMAIWIYWVQRAPIEVPIWCGQKITVRVLFSIHSNIPSGDTDYREPFLAGISGADFQSGGPYQMAINWNGAESTDSPVQMLTVPSDPTGTIWRLEDISSSSLGEDLQKGDIDVDGDLDLFQSKNWLRNNGNGTWTTINTGIDYASTPDRAQLSDFDGDGDLDAVVGQLSGKSILSSKMEFAWFEAPANPAQNWTRHTLASDIRGNLSVFAEDIDLDGYDDIIVGEWKGSNRLIAFENDLCDSGTWIRHIISPGGYRF